jgi:hypothetical protein
LVFTGHLLTSAPFRARPQGQYPASYPGRPPGEDGLVPRFPAAFRCTGVRFLSILFPPGRQLPLRSAYQARCLDPDGFSTFHASETRPGWAPSIPRGRRCSHGRLIFSGRRLPHSNGLALLPRCHLPPTRGSDSRGIIKGSLAFTRPVFSLPVAPGRIGSPWASSLSFPPRSYPRRTSGRRQALSTRLELRIRHSGPPTCVFTRHVRPRVAPTSTRFASGLRGIGTSRCACWRRLSLRSLEPVREKQRHPVKAWWPAEVDCRACPAVVHRGDPRVAGRDRAGPHSCVTAAVTRALWRQVHQARALISHYRRRGDPLPQDLGM